MYDDAADDLHKLMRRLAEPGPFERETLRGFERRKRTPKPIYVLSVDDPDERSIILIVRQSRDGITRAMIAQPECQELPEGWDGPHTMNVAIPLADEYANEYGYRGIAIDIESSQLWAPAWGELQSPQIV